MTNNKKNMVVKPAKKRNYNKKNKINENDDSVIDDFFNMIDVQSDANKKKRIYKKKPTSDKNSSQNDVELNENEKNIIKKNNIIQEKLAAVNKILEMYPFLKKDRVQIVDAILDKKDKKPTSYILERFSYKNKYFYKDPIGNIINSDVDLVGIYLSNGNMIKYFFFDEIKPNPI